MKGLRKLALPPRERLRNLQSAETRWVRGGAPPDLAHQVAGGPQPNDQIIHTGGCVVSTNPQMCSYHYEYGPPQCVTGASC
jgi:hypothetical protein